MLNEGGTEGCVVIRSDQGWVTVMAMTRSGV